MPAITSMTLSALQSYDDHHSISLKNGQPFINSSSESSLLTPFRKIIFRERSITHDEKVSVISEQIKRSYGQEAATSFTQAFSPHNNKLLNVGEIKKFLEVLNKPEILCLGGQNLPSYGHWEANETLRNEFCKLLLSDAKQANNKTEEVPSFEKDAARSFIYSCHLTDGTSITSATGTSATDSSTNEKVALAHEVIEAAIDDISDDLPSLLFLKNSMMSLAHQGIFARLLQIPSLPTDAFIVTGASDTHINLTPSSDKIVMDITADFSAYPSQNTLFHQTVNGPNAIADQDYQIKGTLSFTLEVEAKKDGTIESITCPSLTSSWDITLKINIPLSL